MTVHLIVISLLLLVAILLMLAELLLLPGITVAAIGSLVCYTAAIYYAFAFVSTTAGVLAIVVSVFVSVAILIWVARSKTIDRLSLHTKIEGVSPTLVDPDILQGARGVTLSRLNPMGKVRIGTKIIEAKCLDGLIDEATPVEVISVTKNEIIVSAIV